MVGRRSSVRPDPEVLEDHAVQENPVALVDLVALVAQWKPVALMALANYCTLWGSQRQQELVYFLL